MPADQAKASSIRGETRNAALLAAVAASLVVLPVLLHGFPAGHDTNLHATAWFDLADHWRQGTFLPAWGARFALGLGEPVFLFYPPLSLILGAALTLVFGPALAPSLFVWIATALGGFGTYRLARRLLSQSAALAASVLFIASPYLAFSAYDRNAFAELLASALFPYVLLAFYRDRERRSWSLSLAVPVALLFLCNIPSAVVTVVAVALLTLIAALRERSPRLFWTFASSIALAACFAAFFLLPAVVEKKWIQVERITAGPWAIANNFPFAYPGALFHHEYHALLRDLVLAYLVLLLLGALALLQRDEADPTLRELLFVAGACALLMFAFAAPLYALPAMRFIQFPWRFLIVLSTVLPILCAALLRLPRMRIAIFLVAALFVAAWYDLWPPQFFHESSATWNASFNPRTRQLFGVAEYMPVSVPFGALERAAGQPDVLAVPQSPDTRLAIDTWNAEERRIRFHVATPSVLLIRLHYFPGWQATVNGTPTRIAIDPQSGQIQVEVSGDGELRLRFAHKDDRQAGLAISLLSILAVALWNLRTRRYRT